MTQTRRSPVLLAIAFLIALIGVALGAGGIWLIRLGGSWYYAVAGLGFLLTACLLVAGRPAALWIYALLVLGTLAWALWEAGLNWWPLAARGDIVLLIGLLLLTPWVTRALGAGRGSQADGRTDRVSAFRGGGLALTGALALALAVAAASWFSEPGRIDGTVPARQAGAADPSLGVPPGEWHAYGRTGHGQRYSPLGQITPANVADLDVAWTYRTGDMRGRPGDPEETTS